MPSACKHTFTMGCGRMKNTRGQLWFLAVLPPTKQTRVARDACPCSSRHMGRYLTECAFHGAPGKGSAVAHQPPFTPTFTSGEQKKAKSWKSWGEVETSVQLLTTSLATTATTVVDLGWVERWPNGAGRGNGNSCHARWARGRHLGSWVLARQHRFIRKSAGHTHTHPRHRHPPSRWWHSPTARPTNHSSRCTSQLESWRCHCSRQRRWLYHQQRCEI